MNSSRLSASLTRAEDEVESLSEKLSALSAADVGLLAELDKEQSPSPKKLTEVLQSHISIMNQAQTSITDSLSSLRSTFSDMRTPLEAIARLEKDAPTIGERLGRLEKELRVAKARSLVADAWAYHRSLTLDSKTVATEVANGTISDLFQKTGLHKRNYIRAARMSKDRDQLSHSFPFGHHHQFFTMLSESDVRKVCRDMESKDSEAAVNLMQALQAKVNTASDGLQRPGCWTAPCRGTLTRCSTCAQFFCQAGATAPTCALQPACFCSVECSDSDTDS